MTALKGDCQQRSPASEKKKTTQKGKRKRESGREVRQKCCKAQTVHNFKRTKGKTEDEKGYKKGRDIHEAEIVRERETTQKEIKIQEEIRTQEQVSIKIHNSRKSY